MKYGKWIQKGDYHYILNCSECEEPYRMPYDFKANVYPYNFCPNCGANMILYKQLAEAADRVYRETSIVRPSLTPEQFMELLNAPLIPIPDDTK